MPNDFVYIVNKKKDDENKPEPALSAEKALEYKEDIEKLLVNNEEHLKIHNRSKDAEKFRDTILKKNCADNNKSIKERLSELLMIVEQKRFMRSSVEECVDFLTENDVTLEMYGEWIIGADGSYMCSECGKVFRYEIGGYCSNCGSKNEYTH